MAIHSIFASGSSKSLSPSQRSSVLLDLVSLVSVLITQQLDEFTARLSDAFLHLSEQSVRPAEAATSFAAFNHLRLNSNAFQRAVSGCLENALQREARALAKGDRTASDQADPDLSLVLVSFEEMENKVLIGNISQSLEADIADVLGALNLRLAHLLGRDDMPSAENPFRPQVFLQAIYQGWCKIGPDPESHQVILRLLGPELFLRLDALLHKLNDALIEKNILPDLTDAYRQKKSQNKFGLPPRKVDKRDEGRYNKVRSWLLSKGKPAASQESNGEDLNVPDLFAPSTEGGSWHANTISVRVGPRLFGYLSSLQTQIDQLEASGQLPDVPESASTLRRVKEHVPPGALTQIDENTIELLAKVFDHVFLAKDIPDDIKRLIGQLQIPILKAALLDKKFFVKEDHPARLLVDKIAKTGMALDQQNGREDPLYKMVEQIVVRVQKEFDQQMGLFADAAANLDSFLEEEEKSSQSVLAEPIAEALRQERLRLAREAAENDVSQRIETGEVPGFVEQFLETQWTRILTLAHSVKDKKPEVLPKALQVMDDLIWSVKPKNSPELRKELVSRLPSILSMINAWLNAMKWNDPERVVFFSTLAERHAAMVRIQPELSPRQQVEIAVNIAERASERRLSRRQKRDQAMSRDQFMKIVESLEQGDWLNFERNNGTMGRFKLAWISPQRTRFIFTNRQGQNPFSFAAEELAQRLRDKKASLAQAESVVDRALSAVLEDLK